MSPCAIHLGRREVVGGHMAVGHAEVVPQFDWITLENEVPAPNRTIVPETQRCTKTGVLSH